MISRRLRNSLAIIAGALLAAVPVVLIHRGVDAYIERQATEEVRLAAQRAIARAEWRIGQAITALGTIGKVGLVSCSDVDAEFVRRIVMTTTPLKEVAVVDSAGVPRCFPAGSAASTRALSRELRTADDRVFLSVVRPVDLDGRVLRITWRRAGEVLQLVGHIPTDVFLSDDSPGKAAGLPVVRVMLSEGTVVSIPLNQNEAVDEADPIRVQNSSTRYPLIATATVSRSAVLADHGDLRLLGALASGALAFLIFAFPVLIPLRSRSNPIAEMERALEAGEFIPYYQPLVDLRGGAIVGAEVLMRWRRRDGTIVPPGTFIPLAESSGLIIEMTRSLMHKARDEMGTVLGPRPRVKMGFNLTARHFDNDIIVADLREIFGGSPVRLSQVVLEVTEREPLEDLEMARRVIAALQELGCRIAIDDVGTGHGGLSYMLKLGANYLKIDKMFVDAIGTERYSTTIIETLINLAQSMGMEIFAEGVESFDQVKYLRERGIFLAQGYAFAPPLPGPLFRQLLEAAHPLGGSTSAGTPPAAVGDFMAARDQVAAA